MAGGDNVVGDVYLNVKPLDTGFAPGVQRIIDSAEQKASFGVKANTTQAQQSVNQLADQVQGNLGSAFARVAIQTVGITAAVHGIRAAVQGSMNKLAGLFDQLAQAQAGFSAILKSPAAGNRLLDDIVEFARVSPFVTQQLVNYSQQLLGVGMNASKIVPLLTDVGNVVASVGGDTNNMSRVLFTLTQIQTIGRLTGQDAMQLQSGLVPITKMVANSIGKTTAEVRKMMEQGQISSEMVFTAINQAGAKVPGAMDNAVRTIIGAKSVLSDTITVFFQKNSELRGIYDDVVKGIQFLAAKFDDPAIKGALTAFMDQIGKVYDELQPAIKGLSEALGETAFTGLKMFTVVLEAFAEVLSVIPHAMLEELARIFTVLAALRMPLMLMNYVKSIGTLGALLPAFSVHVAKTTLGLASQGQAVQQAAASNDVLALSLKNVASQQALTAQQTGFLTTQFQVNSAAAEKAAMKAKLLKIASASAMATTVAGTIMAGSDNTAIGTAGGALAGAGTGAMIGAAGGAPGMAIGAIIGATVGGITSYFSKTEAAARKHAQQLKEIGERGAKDYLDAHKAAFDIDAVKAGVALTAEIERIRVLWDKATGDKKAEYWAQYEAVKNEYKSQFGQINESLQGVVSAQNEGLDADQKAKIQSQFFNLTTDEYSGADVLTLKSLPELEKAAARYGLTVKQLSIMSQEEFNAISVNILAVRDATQQAIYETTLWNTAWAKGKGVVDVTLGGRMTQLQTEISAENAYKGALKASTTALENKYDRLSQLQAELAIDQAAEAAGADAYADSMARYNDERAAGLAAQSAILAAHNSLTAVGTGTLSELSAKYSVSEEQLRTILGLQGELDPDLKIVVTVEAEAAIHALEDLAYYAALLKNPGLGDYVRARYVEERDKAQMTYDEAVKAAATFGFATVDPDKTTKSGGSKTDPMVAAIKSMTTAVQTAANTIATAAQAWVTSIKERTQYDTAVSAQRLISNIASQSKDLSEMTTGMAVLRARGLSEVAIKTLGLDSIQDLKQVRKLLRASDTELSAITSGLTKRDESAQAIAASEQQAETRKTITAAIVDAAGQLGYTTTEASATQVANTFQLTATMDPDAIARSILTVLSGGRIG